MRFKNSYYSCTIISICSLFLIMFYYANNFIYSENSEKTARTYPIKSQAFVETLLELTRCMIKIEMWDYNYNYSCVERLEDLIMESGGTPVRSLIVSTWRSGSSFTGDLLNSVPASYYSYEPLKMFNTYKQIRGPPHAGRAITLLKNIFQCNYNNDTDMMKYIWFITRNVKSGNMYLHNRRFSEKCAYKKELCFDANFTSKFCRLSPIHSIKVDRLRLYLVKDLLDDPELKLKVVLLVRDPRAVMHSRSRIKNFCSTENEPDCAQSNLVCTDMVSDYKAAAKFLLQYPDRLMVLRYEDLAFNLKDKTAEMLKFLRLQPTPSVYEFLRTRTKNSSDARPYSTYRVTKDIPFKWKKAMKFDAVREIQDSCREAMSLWGYELAQNSSHLASKDFNPLSNYSVTQDSRKISN